MALINLFITRYIDHNSTILDRRLLSNMVGFSALNKFSDCMNMKF